MARATSKAASDAPRDAIALLKQDHRTVEQLFEEFEEADDDQLQSIAERVCQLLTVHAQIEEELFYPPAKEALSDDEEDADLVNEANVEHQSAKDLIAKIEGMTPEDESFKATVKVLSEYIKHHVKEEEGELFPKVKKTEIDLKELGAQLNERKMALMQELGIEPEPEEAATPKRKKTSGRSGRSSGTKARQARAGSRSKSASKSGRSARH
jgi:hemerythrin superfamily protein